MKKIYALLLCFTICLAFRNAKAQTVHEVTAANFAFAPNNMAVAVGDIVRFRYLSGNNHTTTSTGVPAGAATWNSPLTPTVLVFDYTVTVAGTYTYVCTPHQGLGMVGSFVANAVAPVKMVGLKALTTAANTVKFTWKTETETNADHFSIELSNDGLNFSEAGTVAAAGNSTVEQSYAYTITVPDASINRQQYVYLRVVTVDKDSRKEYSDIVLCKLRESGSIKFVTSIFPVPASSGDHLHLQFNADAAGTMVVTIFDTNGKALSHTTLQAVTGYNQTHMPLPSLARGSYYLRFQLNNSDELHPLVIK